MKPIKVYKIGSDSDVNCIVETFVRLSQLKIYEMYVRMFPPPPFTYRGFLLLSW